MKHLKHLRFLPVFILALVAGQSEQASGAALLTMYQFSGSDGTSPYAGLTPGSDGNLYGTTQAGGARGLGTVFRISVSGVFTNLYSFSGGSDGAIPRGGLVLGSDGAFYGTTQSGGASALGTVFRISASGVFTNLYSFTGGDDGATPQSGLAQGSDGSFYGTTVNGGPSTNCPGGCGGIFKISQSGILTTLHLFNGTNDGWGGAPVVQGSDGNFYGTTQVGGIYSNGAIFRVRSTGAFTTVYSFTGGSDGAIPQSELVRGSDGNFYGISFAGGSTNCPPFGCGTVFEVTPSGILTNLWSFDGGAAGAAPYAGLAQGSDGNFYGTTQSGGASGQGTVFRISGNGVLTNLYSFAGGSNGASPVAGIVQGSDGNFYGTTYNGGTNNLGTVFTLVLEPAAPTVLSAPASSSLTIPPGSSFMLNSGTVAGTLPFTYQWLRDGTNIPGGTSSNLSLVHVAAAQSGDYQLVVSNRFGSVTGAAIVVSVGNSAPGVLFSPFYSFGTVTDANGDPLDGAYPQGGLIEGLDGNLYGTTSGGGSNTDVNGNGFGTVFRITTNGALTDLYSFGAIQDTNGNPLDGASPESGLIENSNGNLYGTTFDGGSYTNANGDGFGTVFDITTNGMLTILHSFGTNLDLNRNSLDGGNPYAALLHGRDGDLYGTTSDGGIYIDTNGDGFGTVFNITTNGVLTDLYSFGAIQDTNGNPLDGANPRCGLIEGLDGNFYGATSGGGSNTDANGNGFGAVFKITTNGVLTVLYSFGANRDANGNPLDGANPQGGLVGGLDGNFYGTTSGGGSNTDANGNGFGTVFKITTNGALTTLYSFGAILDVNGNALDGASPYATLFQGSDGNLYGITTSGGENNGGTVFQISTNGNLTTVYLFSGGNDGANPYGNVIQASDGFFYGTTSSGGTNGEGTVFRFRVGVLPPSFQSVEQNGGILTPTWDTVQGLTYQVQYADDLNQPTWTNLSAPITAIGSSTTASDGLTNSQRFYRIVLLP